MLQVLSKEKDCFNPQIYKITDVTGEGTITCYQVFEGIQFAYNDFHMQSFISKPSKGDNIIEINYCREGRIECQFKNGSYGYMGEGDLSLNVKNNRAIESSFILNHYHGLAITLDLGEAEEALRPFLEDSEMSLLKLHDKYCKDNQFFVMRGTHSIQHIFSELYIIPDKIKETYFKLKVLELLLFLNAADLKEIERHKRYYPKSQVSIIKQIMQYMTEHIDRHVTLDELSKQFEIGLTTMKNCFKGVYGTSIYDFMRHYRIQAAAVMLRESTETITTIAAKVGYDNSSKFAAAFREVMRVAPLEYRKMAV